MASPRYQHLEAQGADCSGNYNQAAVHSRSSSVSSDMDVVELQTFETQDSYHSHLTPPPQPTTKGPKQSQNLARPIAPSEAGSNKSKASLAPKSSTHNPWNSFKKAWANTWLVEIACAIASALSLLAIIAIFLAYSGKQSPQWPHGLTINTIISIFATAMVTFLGPVLGSGLGQLKWTRIIAEKPTKLSDLDAFDNASRGPVGSALLLLGGNSGYAGALGAILTILLLATTSFVQQVIKPVNGNINVNGVAIVQRATTYGSPDAGASIDTPIGDSSVSSTIQAAVYSALFGSVTPTEVSPKLFDCPGGNCTWDPIATLAVCSACKNVSSELRYQTYTPKGKAEWDLRDHFNTSSGALLYNLEDPYPLYNVSIIPRQNNATFLQFVAIGRDSTMSGHGSEEIQIYAEECLLQYCVQTRQPQVMNGQIADIVLQSYLTVTDSVAVANIFDGNFPANISFDPIANAASNSSFNTTFTIGALPLTFLETWMEKLFSVTIYYSGGEASVTTEPNGFKLFDSPVLASSDLNYSSTPAKMIYEAGFANLPLTMQSIATSMSNELRLSSGNNTYGSPTANEVFIDVRWVWLIFPIVVEIGAIIFLICMIVANNNSQARLWKSSSMALLFHGFETPPNIEDANVPKESLETVYGMENTAEKLKVRLESGSDSEQSCLVLK
ncbi:hypothetical protein BP5796_12259 [Coleophoma crateriformis]|uniref:DUF3176 domain containing protein n=1 Tax=Coleophoma crateriformis TaxID=565419 RepID=A0A3D8Q955_9HELO|nr:hypothetical protein BP5796_12259 [Coleophoma crateriformis]